MASSLNLSSFRDLPKLPILDLLKAVAARRSQLRQFTGGVLYQYSIYKIGLDAIESGTGGLLDYSALETINTDGGDLSKVCREILQLQSNIQGLSQKLGEELPRATENLLQRGNVVLFDNPESAGTKYFLSHGKVDKSELIVELLAASETPAHVRQDAERMKTTKELLADKDLAFCLSFFNN